MRAAGRQASTGKRGRVLLSSVLGLHCQMSGDDVAAGSSSSSGPQNGTHYEELEPPSWVALRELCTVCLEHFDSHQDESGLRIKGAIQVVLDTLVTIRPLYADITRIAPLFDFDEDTPGNGYRSFLFLVDKAIVHIGSVCKDMNSQKDSVLFRKTNNMKLVCNLN